jgi:hypothetical protein
MLMMELRSRYFNFTEECKQNLTASMLPIVSDPNVSLTRAAAN